VDCALLRLVVAPVVRVGVLVAGELDIGCLEVGS
jgi:hypothetical protein